jgi:hemerythrin-like domain-containing protein
VFNLPFKRRTFTPLIGWPRREKNSAIQNLHTAPACVIYEFMQPITKTLILEHAVFCKVFEQIERVLSVTHTTQELQLLASVVEGLLADHGETETHLAYAALDHALADRGALKKLYQDHHEIDDHFKRIHLVTDPAEALLLLKKGLKATREHFKREEKTVFPMLEKTLRLDTLRTLGGVWQESNSVAAGGLTQRAVAGQARHARSRA